MSLEWESQSTNDLHSGDDSAHSKIASRQSSNASRKSQSQTSHSKQANRDTSDGNQTPSNSAERDHAGCDVAKCDPSNRVTSFLP